MSATAMQAAAEPALDQEVTKTGSPQEGDSPVGTLPSLDSQPTSPNTNRIQQLLREAAGDPDKEGYFELSADIGGKGKSNHFECKSLAIRGLKEEGIAEITLTRSKKETLKIAIEVDPERVEGFCKELCASYEKGASRSGQVRVKGSSFLSGKVTASLVATIAEDATIVGVSGKGSNWKPPQAPLKGKDSFAALRTLEDVEIGFEKGAFCFREVTLLNPSIGKHGLEKDDFLQGCDVQHTREPAPELGDDTQNPADSKSRKLDALAEPDPKGQPVDKTRSESESNPAMVPDKQAFAALAEYHSRPIETPSVESSILYKEPDPPTSEGACSEVSLAMNGRNVMLSFSFKGNNLPAGVSAQEPANTRIDINFKGAAGAIGPDLSARIATIVSEKIAQSSLQEGVSLTELAVIKELATEMAQHDLYASNVFVENALVEGESELFKEATLGSASLLEVLYHPERIAERPVISNSVIRNSAFKNIAARIEDTVLEGLDVRAGHVHLNADESNEIERISAVGSILSGVIDCRISGDFRRSRLGTTEAILAGKAFAVEDGALLDSTLDKINHFLVDLKYDSSDEGKRPIIKINDEKVRLEQIDAGVKVKKLATLLEDPEYNILPTIDTAEDLRDTFSEQSNLEFDELEQIVRTRDGTVEAKLALFHGDPDTGPLVVNPQLRVMKDDEPLVFELPARPGERLLYALQRLSVLNADRDSIFGLASRLNEKPQPVRRSRDRTLTPDSQLERGAGGSQPGGVIRAPDDEVLVVSE